jgi:hypothetical protein
MDPAPYGELEAGHGVGVGRLALPENDLWAGSERVKGSVTQDGVPFEEPQLGWKRRRLRRQEWQRRGNQI